jgi:hypothetical protein
MRAEIGHVTCKSALKIKTGPICASRDDFLAIEGRNFKAKANHDNGVSFLHN